MSDWVPPQVGGTTQVPVSPVAHRQRWWKRKYKRVPVWGWAVGGLITLSAVSSAVTDEEAGQVATVDGPTTTIDIELQPVADLTESTAVSEPTPAATTANDEPADTAPIEPEPTATPVAPVTMAVVTLPPATTTLPPTTAPPTTTVPPTTTSEAPPVAAEPQQPSGPAVDIATHFDAAGNDNANANKNDEWVRFGNGGAAPLDMTGWVVEDDGPNHTYRFGQLVLQPGEFVLLRSGCGDDGPFERFWCNPGSAVWNNDGDTVHLYDAAGALVATRRG